MAHRNERKAAYEHKRGVASPRLVKLLGADARFSASDEPEEDAPDRGPLTMPSELYDDAAFAEFEVQRTPGKAESWHQRNDSAAMELQRREQDCAERGGVR